MPENNDALLAAIEQARAALDQIEVAAAGAPPEEAVPEAPPEEGGMPMGGMMGKRPMMGE
jgi:hypothetical protein